MLCIQYLVAVSYGRSVCLRVEIHHAFHGSTVAAFGMHDAEFRPALPQDVPHSTKVSFPALGMHDQFF